MHHGRRAHAARPAGLLGFGDGDRPPAGAVRRAAYDPDDGVGIPDAGVHRHGAHRPQDRGGGRFPRCGGADRPARGAGGGERDSPLFRVPRQQRLPGAAGGGDGHRRFPRHCQPYRYDPRPIRQDQGQRLAGAVLHQAHDTRPRGADLQTAAGHSGAGPAGRLCRCRRDGVDPRRSGGDPRAGGEQAQDQRIYP